MNLHALVKRNNRFEIRNKIGKMLAGKENFTIISLNQILVYMGITFMNSPEYKFDSLHPEIPIRFILLSIIFIYNNILLDEKN
jgi:hypothetical protein